MYISRGVLTFRWSLLWFYRTWLLLDGSRRPWLYVYLVIWISRILCSNTDMHIFSKCVLCDYAYTYLADVTAFLTQMCYYTRKHRTKDPHILRESSMTSLRHVTLTATRILRLLPYFLENLCTTVYTQCLKPSYNKGNKMHNPKTLTTKKTDNF